MSLLSLTKKIIARKSGTPAGEAAEKNTDKGEAGRESAASDRGGDGKDGVSLRLVLSEKSVRLQEAGMAVFKVSPDSNKRQIAQAVSRRYKVTVKAVKTMNLMPKERRRGITVGSTNRWKKAYVEVDNVQAINAGP